MKKDFLIVGAGVAGVCTAVHLIKSGVNVTIIDNNKKEVYIMKFKQSFKYTFALLFSVTSLFAQSVVGTVSDSDGNALAGANVSVEGIYSHLALADMKNNVSAQRVTKQQKERFESLLSSDSTSSVAISFGVDATSISFNLSENFSGSVFSTNVSDSESCMKILIPTHK